MAQVSRRLRFEILNRDGFACRYCGAKAPDVPLTVDHVIPTSLGGPNEATNLVTACKDCNAGKSSSNPDAPLVASVTDDALRWARAMRAAMDVWQAERRAIDADLAVFNDDWLGWRTNQGEGDQLPRPTDWPDSVERWFRLGLTPSMLALLIERAMRKTDIPASATWRYFCGCVWRQLEDLRDQAHIHIEILDSLATAQREAD